MHTTQMHFMSHACTHSRYMIYSTHTPPTPHTKRTRNRHKCTATHNTHNTQTAHTRPTVHTCAHTPVHSVYTLLTCGTHGPAECCLCGPCSFLAWGKRQTSGPEHTEAHVGAGIRQEMDCCGPHLVQGQGQHRRWRGKHLSLPAWGAWDAWLAHVPDSYAWLFQKSTQLTDKQRWPVHIVGKSWPQKD